MADGTDAPRDIHLLTTDALLADLIGGRAVALGSGEQLALASDDARAVLDWYRRNHGKWAGKLSAADTDAIIDMIGTPPPTTEAEAEDGTARTNKLLRLVKVEAHRFAGLHAYGRPSAPPASFVFETGKPVTPAGRCERLGQDLDRQCNYLVPDRSPDPVAAPARGRTAGFRVRDRTRRWHDHHPSNVGDYTTAAEVCRVAARW